MNRKNNKFTFIGTWRMAYAGMCAAKNKNTKSIANFVVEAISYIESFEYFKSVGKGGLPNEIGRVEMDAGFMDGKTKNIGAVMAIKGISNPIKLAQKLSEYKYNRMLAGLGAEKWAKENNFKFEKMETKRCLNAYKRKKAKLNDNQKLNPYDGHDTVCFLGTNKKDEMIAATSTSGLFLKKEGRVGDSALTGSGFYADNKIGSAAATGLGEDITRGVLSYETIKNMEKGLDPKKAANDALFNFINDMESRNEKVGSISIIALNTKGDWGVATNCLFQFSIYSNNLNEPKLYVSDVNKFNNGTIYQEVSEGYWDEYINSIKKPIKI